MKTACVWRFIFGFRFGLSLFFVSSNLNAVNDVAVFSFRCTVQAKHIHDLINEALQTVSSFVSIHFRLECNSRLDWIRYTIRWATSHSARTCEKNPLRTPGFRKHMENIRKYCISCDAHLMTFQFAFLLFFAGTHNSYLRSIVYMKKEKCQPKITITRNKALLGSAFVNHW